MDTSEDPDLDVCPHCRNHGEPGGAWSTNAWAPFKLVERVVRSFMFAASVDTAGTLALRADVETDQVDWESGGDYAIECMQCFGEFELPDGADVDFD